VIIRITRPASSKDPVLATEFHLSGHTIQHGF
jgi:hypothetical protein